MVEGDEEFAEAVARCMQGGVDGRDCVVRNAMRGEYVVDDCLGLGGRRIDEFGGFADRSLVGFSAAG